MTVAFAFFLENTQKQNAVFYCVSDIYFSGWFELPDIHMFFSGTVSNKI
jgi:hypothetical protein